MKLKDGRYDLCVRTATEPRRICWLTGVAADASLSWIAVTNR
jgi:hypothetical protein